MSTPSVLILREPLTAEQADDLIEKVTRDLPLEPVQKIILRGILAGSMVRPSPYPKARDSVDTIRVRQALDRIEEARAHGLA